MSQALLDASLDGEQQTVAAGTKRPFISVVMPCLNEERTVANCVTTALDALRASGLDGEVVVADNCSTDASRVEAQLAGARVVNCPQRGYGHAVRCGVEHARGDVILMGDADGSYDFGELPAFVRAIQNGADLVMGNRFLGGIRPGAMPWKNRYFGTPLLTRLVNLLFGSRVGDVQCGLRAFTRDAYKRMRLESGGMELASEMVVKAARARMRVAEVPIILYPDARGRRPHLRPWRDGWRNLKLLLVLLMLPIPQSSLKKGFRFMMRNKTLILRLALICAITSAIVSGAILARAEIQDDKICGFISQDIYASSECKNCTCGCAPPGVPPCSSMPMSAAKAMTGHYRCVPLLSEACDALRIDQKCATRIGYDAANCAGSISCTEDQWTSLNCFH